MPQQRHRRAGEQVGSLEVDVHHLVPKRLVRGLHRSVTLDAGIVGEHVEPAERGPGKLDGAATGLSVGGRAKHGVHGHAARRKLRRYLIQLIARPVEQDQVDALLGQSFGDSTADAHGRPGDQCAFFELSHLSSLEQLRSDCHGSRRAHLTCSFHRAGPSVFGIMSLLA
ncbi:hypothetical protein NKH75_22385 [Mesorhizobium sp. M0984]